jgi:hypothetical protein
VVSVWHVEKRVDNDVNRGDSTRRVTSITTVSRYYKFRLFM